MKLTQLQIEISVCTCEIALPRTFLAEKQVTRDIGLEACRVILSGDKRYIGIAR